MSAESFALIDAASCAFRNSCSTSSSMRRRICLVPPWATFLATSSQSSPLIAYLRQKEAHRSHRATTRALALSLPAGLPSAPTVVPGATPGALLHCRDCFVEQNLQQSPRFFVFAFSTSNAESSRSSAMSSKSFDEMSASALLAAPLRPP